MNKSTIVIIGGNQEKTFQTIGNKKGCDVLFHSGKARNGGVKSVFRPLIDKADCVVLLLGSVGHITMELVRELCKETNTTLIFHKGKGASGAINNGLLAIAG
ncbi:DUF2325 domain-containing protein [Psychrobacillus sp. MER TA 171]|uniref:DUF2325 domain-containing protein n=1 Tax=Psychrobacillus sp. MER TA 171 TaxID=2939577 RepID=UPI00203D8D0D|nr:DUF2325 domain-containing protein [Psychrobacillus sp. MER TA 171]MCM3358103.1 DUF2325 domain-containing protein [Psychrobacillus sp. MER TA 171]